MTATAPAHPLCGRKVRIRLYWFWEIQQEEEVAILDLVKRARENGDHVKLNKDEVARVASCVLVPTIELYNVVDAVVTDEMDMRVYSKGHGDSSILANAAYCWTCRGRFELQKFPFDIQELQLDLRFIDSKFWNQ